MDTRTRASLSIGTLSARTGVSIETIRYYERAGLLPAPPRTPGRHRAYDARHTQRLCFIKRGRELGFSLDDIRTLLQLADLGRPAWSQARKLTLRQLADVRGKIASLKLLERALKDMTDACQPGNQCSCPILDALSAAR
jgi:MerR family mercuric resistance operon transcriptional regulator